MNADMTEKTIKIEISKNESTNEKEATIKSLKFKELSTMGKIEVITIPILKAFGLLAALYFFICSLEIMSTSFRLVGGKSVTEFFKSDLVKNPLTGLMIGLVVTVVVQSSSTSTSIIVSMVAADIVQVPVAIPIIYGVNIGTSITSALVSLGQMGDKEKFRRAFAGAIIHDTFNFLSVCVLLPIELATGYTEKLSLEIVKTINFDSSVKEPEFLNAITKPLTQKIIRLDKNVLTLIATSNDSEIDLPLIKHCTINSTSDCDFLFEKVGWPEWSIGLLLLVISLIVLCSCLILMVKLLSSVFQGHFKNIITKTVNADFPGVFKYFTPYVAMLLGCGLTILVQSSSVFTSSLVPLVSLGLFTLERVFPLILGANIGTTVTGILAAFSADSKSIRKSLQIALCHTLFNISGILIWYPIAPIRRIPIRIAVFLSDITATYRWFAPFFLILMFMLLPAFFFTISLAGSIALYVVLALIIILIFFVITLNVLQNKIPNRLPVILRTWEFLPIFMRTLEPYDRIMTKLLCCKKFKTNDKVTPSDNDFINADFYTETKVIEKQNESQMNEKQKITITSF